MPRKIDKNPKQTFVCVCKFFYTNLSLLLLIHQQLHVLLNLGKLKFTLEYT